MSGISYLCAPYRGDVDQNILNARIHSVTLWRAGDVVLCPHTNTAFFDQMAPDVDDGVWLDGCIRLLQKCDRLVLVPQPIMSDGMRVELEFAQANNIRVLNFSERLSELKGGDR